MSPITSYRQLLRLAGAGYVAIAFLGRLPLAMSQLGTLLLVSTATGRYGLGGLTAGALAVANAVGSPVAGAIADRIGQRPVVLVQSVVAGVALSSLVAAVESGASSLVLVSVAICAGLSIPQVGPLARARWRPITRETGERQRRLVDTAFSYEGAADEASFMLGPALVGAVAVVVDPGGALLVAAALLVVFGSWFALHPTARLAHTHRARTDGAPRPFVSAEFVVLAVAQLLIGIVFGATQTGTTVLATADGQPGLAGLVHALLAVGSVLAGLAVAGLPERFGYERRILVFAGALLVLSAPLLLVGSLGGLVPVVLALGFAVAPYMISVFVLAEKIVPQTRVGAALTILAGATGVGYAVGSAVAGRIADVVGGYRPAFAVTVAAAVLAVVLATTFRRRLAAALQRGAATPSSSDGSGSAWTITSEDTARVSTT
ncbi:MFS transporter [Haloactinopolyspora alba]|uniref:MFS transporter n=1 Tax=Haloactinopolyspora alba TaxID=648780 RepID=A0A2P8DM39_9ACTN|nr:MFS transporter [Haloactinopolyspora alba]PSK98282.1 MFS transporter [Haloactinopolyspora alba]